MSAEKQLILEIQKHQCLYNYNLPEYNRKDVSDEAWALVAAYTNLSVVDCKEKWRNIRSSFLRSLKQTGPKPKKPYYLSEYLQFILPFMKRNLENVDELRIIEFVDNNVSESDDILIKAEPNDPELQDPMQFDQYKNGINKEPSIVASASSSETASQTNTRKGKRSITPWRSHSDKIKYKHRKFRHISETTPRVDNSASNNNSIRLFLDSLLPEFETMTEEQIRMFKIKVMMLIDDIKTNYDELKQNTILERNHSQRLQKRLITLLLKSLQRRA